MSNKPSAPFDAAAFLAAVQAASQQPPKPITLPGIGACFKRELSVADVEAASVRRAELQSSGTAVTSQTNIAIGLAQVLCGPDGVLIFDMRNPAHMALLTALPWASVSGVMQADAEEEATAKNA